MPAARLMGSSALRKQSLLTEFAGLQAVSPPGVFMSLTPGNATLWAGVLFVRQGPYAPAILRLQISFPVDYPALPPLVTFESDIFHPLLTPLSTLTYTTDIQESGTVSATDDERLPPGGFSLRHGFPAWFGRANRETATVPRICIYEVLDYIRTTFDDEKVLDSVTVEAAANPNAWHAWRSHRVKRKAVSQRDNLEKITTPDVPATPPKQPGEWNWDGVWQLRAKRGIDATLTEPALYGNLATNDELIRFLHLGEEQLASVTEGMKRSVET